MPFVVGRPGEGKTYWLMTYIAFLLVYTKRNIVTNLVEIKMPELQAFLARNYPLYYEEGKLDLEKRIRWIPKTSTKWFFRYRLDFELPECDPKFLLKETPSGERDAYYEKYFSDPRLISGGGIDYILDEAHRHFSAEEYAEIPYISRFYQTQHRHLDDNITLSTQSPEQVVVQMRRLGGPCHVISNHYNQSFSIFQKKGGFQRRSYYTVTQAMKESVEPYETVKTKLDKKGLANCYYTRGALGAMPDTAETKVAKKKLPFWSIWVAFGLVGTAVCLSPFVLFKGAKKLGESVAAPKKGSPAKTGAAAQARPAPEAGAKRGRDVPSGSNNIEPSPSPAGLPQVEPTRLLGYAASPRGVRIVLSDGRVLTDRDGVVEVQSNWARMSDGTKYFLGKVDKAP